MYCASCGSSVKPNLSYCNACGAKLNNAKEREPNKQSSSMAESLIWAIVAVTIAGLGILIGLMSVMKNELHFDNGITLGFASLVLALIIAVDATFIWQFLRRSRSDQEASDMAKLRELITKELDTAPPRALREPAPSVTEHTTRSIDPLYSERNAE